jgi:Tol biopolymer transport system component
VPPAVCTLLKRCLEKDRKQRIADVSTAHFLLIEHGSLTPAVVMTGTAIGAAGPHARRARERMAWAAGLVFAAGAGAVVMFSVVAVRLPAEVPEIRADINTPMTSDPMSFAISPDGRRLVFVASGDGESRLWVRSLESGRVAPIARTEGASSPFWSPNGRSIGFVGDAKLKRVDINGGPPQTLEASFANRGATWGPGEVILFASGTSLFRISAAGGTPVPVTEIHPPRESGHRFPEFLPDGRRFLFYVVGTDAVRGIYLGSLDSHDTTRLTAADAKGAYLSPGWLVFVREGALVAQRLNLDRQALLGEPITIADPVGFDNNGAAAFSIATNGMLTYRAAGSGRRQLAWFDHSGKPLGALNKPDDSGLTGAALSPDGRRAAVHRTVNGNTDVWLIDRNRSTRFTTDPADDLQPQWSPDGTILFDSNRNGVHTLYRKPLNGAGTEERLWESSERLVTNSVSPDGRWLSFTKLPGNGTASIGYVALNGDRKARAFGPSEFDARASQFSPNGHWMAYQSNKSGRYDIWVAPFPGPGGEWQVSTAGGVQVRWSPDGKELYYIAPDSQLMAVPFAVNGAMPELGAPTPLFQTRIWGGGTTPNQGQQYDVAPDGRFLINVTTEDAPTSPITLLLNWKPPAQPGPKG